MDAHAGLIQYPLLTANSPRPESKRTPPNKNPLMPQIVWNRRKQEWMEVDADAVGNTPQKGASPTSNPLSSNAFASGVSQNAGNFLTDKPITRVHRPPGGVSSICFGDDSAPAAAGVAKPQAGHVLGTPTQPATPESADSVENGPAPIPMMELPPAPAAVEEEETAAAEEEGGEEEEDEEDKAVPPPAPVAEAVVPEVISANAYASGSNQNSGNFMTGRPTTRVRAPPGGASSITFG